MLFQSYTPFREELIPLFFYYVVLVIFSTAITLAIFRKYNERKTKPTLDLALVFLVLTAAIIVIMLGFLEAYVLDEFREFYKFSLPFGYGCISIANIFLFQFASDITGKAKKAIIPVAIISIALVVVLFLPWNFWGEPSGSYDDSISIRLYSTLALVGISYVIYISIAVICNKAKKGAKNAVAKLGLNLLVYAMICLILFFLMFIFDTIMIALGDEGYTFFVWIAWAFAIAFYLLMYMSLIMPKWLEDRIKKD